MPRGSSPKRERQYEHIKESALDRGEGRERAEEIAARTVNKGARPGRRVEDREPHVHPGHLLRQARRPALPPGRPGTHVRPAVRGGQAARHPRPVGHEQGGAEAGAGRQVTAPRPRPVLWVRLVGTMNTSLNTVPIPAGWPATTSRPAPCRTNCGDAWCSTSRAAARHRQKPATGVDVAYDDERDVVVAAAVVLDTASLTVVAEATAVLERSPSPTSPVARLPRDPDRAGRARRAAVSAGSRGLRRLRRAPPPVSASPATSASSPAAR